MAEDMEIEEVSFLSGEEQNAKRSKYEPERLERCQQIMCSQQRAVFVVLLSAILILSVALIAALTKTPCYGPIPELQFRSSLTGVTTELMVTTEALPETDSFPWKDLRLPTNVRPLNYEIFLHPNLTSRKYSGRVVITVRFVEAGDFLVLHHAKELEVQSHRAHLTEAQVEVPIVKTVYNAERQQRYLRFSTNVDAGTIMDLRLTFASELSETMSGFYISHYKTSKGELRPLATTQFEPSDARRAFPCFDEPSYKATFILSIVRDRQHVTLFNMPKIRSEAYRGDPDGLSDVTVDDLMLDHYQHSVVMSTYLVAYVVCDFLHVQEKSKRNVTVSVYTPPEMIGQASFALKSAVKVLDYYEAFFQIDYPLPKLDLIAIPDFDAGAMENWGLITYRMTSILYDEEISGTYDREMVAVTVAHEIAHQWFGNLVTMQWWNDLWLNEGFATYVEYIGANVIDPDLKMEDQFLTDSVVTAFKLDSSTQSHPIDATITDPLQIASIFDAISYEKGASILRMLAEYIGNTTFHQGLFEYLTKHKMGNAQTSDLWQALSEAYGNKVNITSLMDTWTRQMGYPVVTVEKREEEITLSQKRFLINPDANVTQDSPFNYTWKVPLTYITDTIKSRQTLDFFNQSATFTLAKPSDWIKVNVKSVGFYRVNYDADNWRELTDLLLTSHLTLTGTDRAGLLDDAFALSRAGLLSTKTVMDMMTYLRLEQDYIPWNVALYHIGYIDSMLRNTPVQFKFRQHLLSLLRPMIEQLGWEDKGTSMEKYLRMLVLGYARQFEDEATIANARKIFSQYMNNDTRVSPNLKNVVYESGVAYGGQAEFDHCYKVMNTSGVPTEVNVMIGALAEVRDSNTIQRLLEMTLDPALITAQTAPTLIHKLGRNPAATILAWQFVRKHWDNIVQKYGISSFSSRSLMNIPSVFSEQYDLDQVEAFYREKNLSHLQDARVTIETIKTNIRWRQQHEKDISSWLSSLPAASG